MIIVTSGPSHEGYLVIDSLVRQRSAGGVRVAADMTLAEVRELAHEMTLKYSLFRLPRGGAKAGVRLADDLDQASRLAALRDFGRQIAPAVRVGLYNPGTDMNCGLSELGAIYEGIGLPLGPQTDTSYYTAVGMADAILACAGACEMPFPVSLAIEGFGSVANHMVGMLPPEQFRVTAISTVRGAVADARGLAFEALRRGRAAHGDDLVHHLPGDALPREALLGHEVDILVPAARTGTITLDLAEGLCARAVVPAANAPYRLGAANRLHERGVLCLPGYLCNAGGVFGSTLADNGVSPEEVRAIFRARYRPLIGTLARRCRTQGVSPIDLVDDLAIAQAGERARRESALPLAGRVWERVMRRLPRAMRRREALSLCREAFDAMDRVFGRES